MKLGPAREGEGCTAPIGSPVLLAVILLVVGTLVEFWWGRGGGEGREGGREGGRGGRRGRGKGGREGSKLKYYSVTGRSKSHLTENVLR